MSLPKNLDVIFQDDSILVLNKPSGLVVNISDTSPQDTLQDLMRDIIKIDPEDMSEFAQRNGIVHRIDKDTSGLLLVAKNKDAFNYLKSQFMHRTVKKEYVAIVLGRITEPLFEINAPIIRNPRNRMKMAVGKKGREAMTRFELANNFNLNGEDYSVLKCFPETGRTHQLRVHLAALQHPIAGDEIYMTRKQLFIMGDAFKRLMLHAWKIEFKHPKLQEELFFEAPLPEEFKKFIQNPIKN